MEILHITNGDAVGQTLQSAGFTPLLIWRDVLHEGPIPAGADEAELDQARAHFLASRGWTQLADVQKDFAYRRQTLDGLNPETQVVLWFEHDLYDQLQIWQIVHDLAGRQKLDKTELICIGSHPEIQPFFGLGQLNAKQLSALYPQRVPLAAEWISTWTQAWAAFQNNPLDLNTLTDPDCPFYAENRLRLMQEFPDLESGINLTERLILTAVSQEVTRLGDVFRWVHRKEAAPFMGDLSFFASVEGLIEPEPSLLTGIGAEINDPACQLLLTELGRAVLMGQAHAEEHRRLDRWLGGAHLTNRKGIRFDRKNEALVLI
ncbi:MAG: DUF1835 domain-containing protein [Acidobacteria bacterium]|nr:DUF1835 domain-containing protein [Acidobacteriota bacterium]MCB9399349.1 DUF1835 domain-containing protein [Acidobacteriota bacterium]